MRKIVQVSAGRVRIRTNSVCKELGPAGAIEKLVAGVRDNARSCVMRVSIRTSSVWKELGHVGATAQPADNAYGFHLNAERRAPTSSYAATTKNVYPKPRGRAAPNEKNPRRNIQGGWRRGGQCSVVQGPIAELRRGDFGAPVAVAAFLAQRVGEVCSNLARGIYRHGETRDDAALRRVVPGLRQRPADEAHDVPFDPRL